MAKGYIIGHVTVTNAEAYKDYVARDTPMFLAAGARILIRGGEADNVEGPKYDRHVVFEFESYKAAYDFYYSPDYQDVLKIRHANADSMIVLVEGYEE
ncbi:MAG: DUF1330 domain-containing protein [Octadecabacter sp.]